MIESCIENDDWRLEECVTAHRKSEGPSGNTPEYKRQSIKASRTEYSAVTDHQDCQTRFILTILQRLTLLSLSIILSAGLSLSATHPPEPPLTSTLGPRHVKVVSIRCRIHLLLFCTLDSVLPSLKFLFWQNKTKKK